MGFRPRMGKCKDCGADFWKRAAAHVRCEACQEIQKEVLRQRRIASAKVCTQNKRIEKRAKKLGVTVERYMNREPHQCLGAYKCEYGDKMRGQCNYFTITEQLRTAGGKHKIKNGCCDLFPGKVQKGRPGWERDRERNWERENRRRKAHGKTDSI